MEELAHALTEVFADEGWTPEAWVAAWLRLMPTLIIVPAFGARLLVPAGRAVLGLALGALAAPALVPHLTGQFGLWQLAGQLVAGLPVALSAGALLWAASMAGDLAGELSGLPRAAPLNLLTPASPLGTLLGLFAALVFLEVGGVEQTVRALVPITGGALEQAALTLVASLHIALAMAAPLLAAAIVWEVAGGLLSRAASPAYIHAALAPLRCLVILAVLTFSLEGLMGLIIELISAG